MNRFVAVLGTTHEVQNGEKYWRRVDDPHFKPLLDMLVAEDTIDFIFEEATRLGPTIAEKLALTWGPDRYLDVDPPREERLKFGIPENTNQPISLGSPFDSPPAISADRAFHEAHAKREEHWLRQIMKQDFKKALMVCGQNHALSFAFRLSAANFNVKTITYAPPLPPAPLEAMPVDELMDMFLDSVTELSKRDYIRWCDGEPQRTTLEILVSKGRFDTPAVLHNAERDMSIGTRKAMARLQAHLQNLGVY
jgi:hypothetical protein